MVGRKRFKYTVFFLVFLLFIPSVSKKVEAKEFEKQRIYDYAGLLSLEEVEDLENLAGKYSRRRETDIIILTSNDTGGRFVVEYMQDFYDDKGLGYDKAHGNVAILTLDMANRDVNVSGFYKAETYLDDKRADMVRRKITPKLSDGDYYGGFKSFIKTSYKYMGVKPGVNPNNIFLNIWFQLAISLGVAVITVGIILHRVGGRITVSEVTYRDSATSRVVSRSDDYVRTSVQKVRRPSSNSSGGSSGGGMGGGMTSGGHSHSGSTGKF